MHAWCVLLLADARETTILAAEATSNETATLRRAGIRTVKTRHINVGPTLTAIFMHRAVRARHPAKPPGM
jgi:hypothetical protein